MQLYPARFRPFLPVGSIQLAGIRVIDAARCTREQHIKAVVGALFWVPAIARAGRGRVWRRRLAHLAF